MARQRAVGAGRAGSKGVEMNVRGIVGAAMAVLLVATGPAHAERVVQGTWSGGWRSWSCGSGLHTWSCLYYFNSDDCVETSVGVTGDVGAQLDCNVWLDDSSVSMQHRVNSAGRRVGCISTSGHGWVDYYSAYPGMSQSDIPVDIAVHDGWVAVSGTYTTDGAGASRTYYVEIAFEASCGSSAVNAGYKAAYGSVTIDVA